VISAMSATNLGRVTVRWNVDQSALRRIVHRDLGRGLRNAAQVARKRIRQTYSTALTRRTGALYRSVKYSPVRGRYPAYSIVIYSDSVVAIFHEWGTRTPIRPVNARILTWVDPSGRRIWARQVRGVRATRAFTNAAKQVTGRDFM